MQLQNKPFKDFRGYNMKFFQRHIADEVGFNDVKEVFVTTNAKGVTRAFHFQNEPNAQQKIIKPLAGRFNVRIVDMENEVVHNYDNWGIDSDPLFVKAGNMLGYVSLEDNSTMLYIADNEFSADDNVGVHPNSFNVDWNFDGEQIISERDQVAEIVDFNTPREQYMRVLK